MTPDTVVLPNVEHRLIIAFGPRKSIPECANLQSTVGTTVPEDGYLMRELQQLELCMQKVYFPDMEIGGVACLERLRCCASAVR